MEVIISNIKSIVIIIVASEFLKNFLLGDKFKKYITICVNILVMGFIIGQIKNTPYVYNLTEDIPDYKSEDYENGIKTEYEQRVSSELRKMLEDKKISVYSIEVISNDDYSIKKIIIHISGRVDTAEEILKGLKPEDYEIIVQNQQ